MNQQPVHQPNILWILSDQHRAQALSWNGDRNVHTPGIDSLIRNGTVFSNACAGAPWCTPFRGALLTGMYPHVNGCTQTPSRLDPKIPTVAHRFKEAGYHTAWVGKWHLAGSNDSSHLVTPELRGGFDHWFGYENNNKQNDVWVYGTGQEEPRRLSQYETQGLSTHFIQHLEDHLGRSKTPTPSRFVEGQVPSSPGEKSIGDQPRSYQPFFACLSVQPPHSPYVPPADSRPIHPQEVALRPNVPVVDQIQAKARRDIAGYSGMVEEVDRMVSYVRQELKRLGVDKETYVFYFSDHGDMLGSHGQWEKSSPWEESIRIPMVIGTVEGQESILVQDLDLPLNHVDIAPTSLGLCSIPTPPQMQGYDYSRFVVHPNRQTDYHKSQTQPVPEVAYLQQIPRKFHPYSVNRAWRGIITRDRWKYICSPGNDWFLFDLKTDPFEMANLAFDIRYRDKKIELHRFLKSTMDHLGDRFELPREEDL